MGVDRVPLVVAVPVGDELYEGLALAQLGQYAPNDATIPH